MVRAEAVLIAAVAVVAGVALGLGLAATTLAGLASDTPLTIRVPVVQLLAVVGAAVLGGLVAGPLPARRGAPPAPRARPPELAHRNPTPVTRRCRAAPAGRRGPRPHHGTGASPFP